MLLFPEQVHALILKMTNGGSTYAPFLTYDEDNLCIDFLKQYNRIELESADEYSIVFARLAIKYTDVPIYYTDDRFTWFINDNNRMNKVETANGELGEIAVKIQETITERTSKVAGVMAVKAMADMMGQIPKLTYKEAAGLFANFSNWSLFTFNAYYVQRIEENEYSILLDSMYGMYPSTGAMTVLEMIALPDKFCISMNQGGQTKEYADAFCGILSENGVACKIEGKLQENTGYIELREYEGWK